MIYDCPLFVSLTFFTFFSPVIFCDHKSRTVSVQGDRNGVHRTVSPIGGREGSPCKEGAPRTRCRWTSWAAGPRGMTCTTPYTRGLVLFLGTETVCPTFDFIPILPLLSNLSSIPLVSDFFLKKVSI